MADHFFAREFEHAGLHHTRRDATPPNIRPTHVKHRLTLPEGLGVALLECYEDGERLFTRLYHVQSGAFAWYDVEMLPVSPSSPETPTNPSGRGE